MKKNQVNNILPRKLIKLQQLALKKWRSVTALQNNQICNNFRIILQRKFSKLQEHRDTKLHKNRKMMHEQSKFDKEIKTIKKIKET